MDFIRNYIGQQVRSVTVVPGGIVDMENPRGDPGLFGPGSMPWEIHRDFTSMIIGGISALLMQMLHPLALAGVWDHSNFRTDLHGRLRRTSQFIGGTSFAGLPSAHALINRVRAIHEKVQGVTPEGMAYKATDPALLTWVHVAEVRSFLTAYLTHFNPSLPLSAQDRYYREVAKIAFMLGAEKIPQSVDEVEAYFEAMQPELIYTARTKEVCDLITQAPQPSPFLELSFQLYLGAAIDLLPAWAAAKLHVQNAHYKRPLIKLGVAGAALLIRRSLPRSAYRLAHARMGLHPLPATQPNLGLK